MQPIAIVLGVARVITATAAFSNDSLSAYRYRNTQCRGFARPVPRAVLKLPAIFIAER